ncbi:MAG: tetraacyldisaccharide 4'-kinase [bacterium]
MLKLYKIVLRFLENNTGNGNKGEGDSSSDNGDYNNKHNDSNGNNNNNRMKSFLNILKNFIKLPLFAVSSAVIVFSKLKRILYSKNIIFKTKNPNIFTISVGNINMGGSGKTPLSYSIASYLYNYGLKPCIVSRGYGAKLKKKSISQAGNGNLIINSCSPMKHCF